MGLLEAPRKATERGSNISFSLAVKSEGSLFKMVVCLIALQFALKKRFILYQQVVFEANSKVNGGHLVPRLIISVSGVNRSCWLMSSEGLEFRRLSLETW